MKNTLFSILFLLMLAGGCSRDEILIDRDNLLIGVWNFSEFKDNSMVFLRNNEFIDNHCYEFNSNGTMTERKNSGSCGTPPVIYADFSGSWTVVNDTLIRIKVGYWGGTISYKLDIEEIDSNSLTASYFYEDN